MGRIESLESLQVDPDPVESLSLDLESAPLSFAGVEAWQSLPPSPVSRAPAGREVQLDAPEEVSFSGGGLQEEVTVGRDEALAAESPDLPPEDAATQYPEPRRLAPEPWVARLEGEVLPWPVGLAVASEVLPGEWSPPAAGLQRASLPQSSPGASSPRTTVAEDLGEGSKAEGSLYDEAAEDSLFLPDPATVSAEVFEDANGVLGAPSSEAAPAPGEEDWLRGLDRSEGEVSVGYEVEVLGTVDEPGPTAPAPQRGAARLASPSDPEGIPTEVTSLEELEAALAELPTDLGELDAQDLEEDDGPPTEVVEREQLESLLERAELEAQESAYEVEILSTGDSVDEAFPELELEESEDEEAPRSARERLGLGPEAAGNEPRGGASATVAAVVSTLRGARPAAMAQREVRVRVRFDLSDPSAPLSETPGEPRLWLDLVDPSPGTGELPAPGQPPAGDGDGGAGGAGQAGADPTGAELLERGSADVVAEGGAIRVELALGSRPPDLAHANAGVAVAPAEPVRSWPGRSDADLDDRTTDLVALARGGSTDSLGPGESASAAAVHSASSRADEDDWLDGEQGPAKRPGPMSPHYLDTVPGRRQRAGSAVPRSRGRAGKHPGDNETV